MDLLQKYGHLKHDKDAREQRRKSMHTECQSEQDHFNSLLGSFGKSENDHPDRRSSGAGNMSDTIKKAQGMVSNAESSEK